MAGWSKLPFGAGGQVLSMDISPDGTTRLIYTDACGAYIWNSTSSLWEQLVTTARMPSADIDPTLTAGMFIGGSYSVVCAPNDPTRIYLANNATRSGGGIANAGRIYVSSDR